MDSAGRIRIRLVLDPWRDLVSLLAPGPCPLCRQPLPRRVVAGICPACWAGLARLAELGAPGPIVAAFRYEGELVTLHRRLKFGGDAALARPLGRRMAAAFRRAGRPGAQLVVPVAPDPLRLPPRRLSARRLARAVARELGLPRADGALRKVRHTKPQTGLGRRARLSRMTGLFRARAALVAGRRILLIDDVVTTGATVREAARALSEAGAAGVEVLALARTPPPAARTARSAGAQGAVREQPLDLRQQIPRAERLGQDAGEPPPA